MKKKLLALFLSAVLMGSLAACDAGGSSSSASGGSGTTSSMGGASIPEGMKKAEESGISFAVPEGFEKMSDDPIIYMKKDSDETDNILLTFGEKDSTFDVLTESTYKKLLQSMYEGATVTMSEFERVQISGHDAIKTLYILETEGATLQQAQVIINANQMYTISYTMANDTLKDYVQPSIDSIQVTD